ncbi:MAG: ABC-F family ATP-binding cassette domain-containing protein [Muribaculaceae bacterium]|nr:ABC-F family ATP-binding cassette domain-containing protein [Muribaculaceae bacterium]
MASYLQIENLTKSVGDRMLFADVTLGINEGDKIGIIAKNGAGKSTLLRILAGREDYDSGKIAYRNGLRVRLLDQDSVFPEGMSVIEACLAAEPAPAEHSVADDGGYAYEQRMRQLLTQLGIDDCDAQTQTMSGGQRKRMALACALISEPDFLMLDEPTNHLDIKVIEWLESYLKRARATLLMVTHDRYFLDRVCNKIIEIDREQVYSYDGNYDYYLRRRQERIDAMGAELARVKNTLRREQDWMNRQPQARATKAKARIDQFYELKERSRTGRADRNVNLDISKAAYIGNKIFEAEGISKRFGDKVILDNFTYTFARGEKVGIIGPNGIGKSTFIKMLLGLVPQDNGQWNVGETVRFGYYSQDGIEFDEKKKVIDAVQEIAEDIVTGDGTHLSPMQFLQHFLFSVPDQQKYIYKLSGGERRRLHLATVLMRNPNFLILDEPTNDLDIVTLGLLEDYLAQFKGCAIVVSHDRYFLDNIVDHLFVMEGNGIVKDFPGTYTEYIRWAAERAAAAEPKAKEEKAPQRQQAQRPPKLSFKEKRELEALEAKLEALYAEKAELDALFNSGQEIPDIAAKSERFTSLSDEIDECEMRWLELKEKEQPQN